MTPLTVATAPNLNAPLVRYAGRSRDPEALRAIVERARAEGHAHVYVLPVADVGLVARNARRRVARDGLTAGLPVALPAERRVSPVRSVRLPAELLAYAQGRAAAEGVSLSGWVARLVREERGRGGR